MFLKFSTRVAFLKNYFNHVSTWLQTKFYHVLPGSFLSFHKLIHLYNHVCLFVYVSCWVASLSRNITPDHDLRCLSTFVSLNTADTQTEVWGRGGRGKVIFLIGQL